MRHHHLGVANQRGFGGNTRADLLGSHVELHYPQVLAEARRQAEVHDPVKPRADGENQVGILQRVGARRGDAQRMAVWNHALTHRRRKERHLRFFDETAHLVLGACPRGALADDRQRLARRFQGRQRRLYGCRIHLRGGRRFHARRIGQIIFLHAAGNDVARQVEVHGAGPPGNRMAHRGGDVTRDQIDALRLPHPLAERLGEVHLRRRLKVAHVVQGLVGGAADQQHGPAIGPCIAERGDGVRHAGAGHHETRPDAALHVRNGLRRVARRLLMAGADVADAFARRRRGDAGDGNADHAEQFIHALLLQAPGHKPRAIDLSHELLLLEKGKWSFPVCAAILRRATLARRQAGASAGLGSAGTF